MQNFNILKIQLLLGFKVISGIVKFQEIFIKISHYGVYANA